MIVEKKGDLFTTTDPIIAHQVNCQRKMNSGVARLIREKYPYAYEVYMQSLPQLGKCSLVHCADGMYIANLYGQEFYGYDGKQYTSKPHLRNALVSLFEHMKAFHLDRLSIPRLGCGLGGMVYADLVEMLHEVTPPHITVTVWYI